MRKLSKEEVINFVKSESECGVSIVSSTNGQGGAGLDVSVWDESQIKSLKSLIFDGPVSPIDDILESEYYEEGCIMYQFSEDSCGTNPSVLQIMTY